MATKKKTDKKIKEIVEVAKSGKYFAGVGRRKLSVARVRISKEKKKGGAFLVNERDVKIYFPLSELLRIAMSPLDVAGESANFSVSVKVSGGGIRGQAEAIRLGLSRALVSFDEKLKKPLRDLEYLTRDDRVVERKKAGLKKARRAPQWKKR